MRTTFGHARRTLVVGVTAALALAALGTRSERAAAEGSVGSPVKGQRVADFESAVAYVDASGGRFGTRWVHVDNDMPVTVLRIQSVPQVFLYVDTPPVSDRGEPHTGEHLLLGKGTKGKQLGAAEGKSLIGSTAWTDQTDVVYAWNCAAGKETFFASVDRYLDALLLPDYTDEEVRREVMNLGVAKDDAGRLSLEEKGTIYNEMVSTYEKRWNLWGAMRRRLWGADHPNGQSSGGEPAAIRTMQPEHIHEFHRDHYHLSAGFGMLVALPDSVPEREFLERLSATVRRLDADPELAKREKKTFTIPPAQPQLERELQIVPYPNANEGDTGIALFAWPPVADVDQRTHVLAQVLMGAITAGDTGTLHRRLIDSSTRDMEIAASSIFGWMEAADRDEVIFIGFDGYPAHQATQEFTDQLVGVFHDEFARIATLKPGSDELREFNERIAVGLTSWERGLLRQLSAPPLFGHRGEGGFWAGHLRLVDRSDAYERPVALGGVFADIRKQLAEQRNPWRSVITKYGLGGDPYAAVSVASKADLARRGAVKADRIDRATEELRRRFDGVGAQEAVARYATEIDAVTEELDARDAALPAAKLVDDVPLRSDPSLVFEELVWGDVAGARGVFENMSFVEVALYFDLHGIPEEHQMWLPYLTNALTGSGVVVDGEPLAYDEAQRQRNREIYGLDAQFSMHADRGRHELRVTATGGGIAEAKRAIEWMERCLHAPWLAEANLSRVRDMLNGTLLSVRGTLGGAEENWVDNPADALRHQRDHLYLSANSLHTALLHLTRAEWQLTELPPEHVDAVRTYLESLPARVRDDPAETAAVIARKNETLRASENFRDQWVGACARRIPELIGDMAPGSQKRDLRDLARLALKDLVVSPKDALAALNATRAALLHRHRTRFVLTGSTVNTDAIRPRLEQLFAELGDAERAPLPKPAAPIVHTRLRDHQPDGPTPVHHGLVHGAGTSGVFLHSATSGDLDALDNATLQRDLAARVVAGGGAHAFFMQTWGAGLAYSNGLSVRSQSGRINYYAERCPDLVETMRFVEGVAESASRLDDPALAEYVIALAVAYSRESSGYESRTRSQAAEIVDGATPERVEAFRRAALALRNDATLWATLRPQVLESVGRVLPGLGPKSRDVPGGNFLVIAPEPLLANWETWIKEHEGSNERVYRIHGRDFWIVPE